MLILLSGWFHVRLSGHEPLTSRPISLLLLHFLLPSFHQFFFFPSSAFEYLNTGSTLQKLTFSMMLITFLLIYWLATWLILLTPQFRVEFSTNYRCSRLPTRNRMQINEINTLDRRNTINLIKFFASLNLLTFNWRFEIISLIHIIIVLLANGWPACPVTWYVLSSASPPLSPLSHWPRPFSPSPTPSKSTF